VRSSSPCELHIPQVLVRSSAIGRRTPLHIMAQYTKIDPQYARSLFCKGQPPSATPLGSSSRPHAGERSSRAIRPSPHRAAAGNRHLQQRSGAARPRRGCRSPHYREGRRLPHRARRRTRGHPRRNTDLRIAHRWHLGLVVARSARTSSDIRLAAEVLWQLAEDKSNVVRSSAVEGLGLLARRDPALRNSIEPFLHQALISGTPAMRVRARNALCWLQSGAANKRRLL
jgi:hypothetical protein